MITVSGNTYPVKDQLKTLGGQWDGDNKRWLLPDEAQSTIEQIRVPVGGREQLWEPCTCCGEEPVDGSGLCRHCRGTQSLTVRPLKSVDDEAQDLINRPGGIAMALYDSASAHGETTTPASAHQVGKGSPFDGGYHVELLTDGTDLYTLHVHHYEGDRDRCYRVQPERFQPTWKRAVELLISMEAA